MDLIYDSAKRALMTGKLDMGADDIFVMLASGYKPEAGHSMADIPETSGEGYTKGGKPIQNRKFSRAGVFSADNMVWPSSTIKACHAILYKKPSLLITAHDLGKGKASSNGDFLVEWSKEGILSIGSVE